MTDQRGVPPVSSDADRTDDVRAAIDEVRREGYKVAFVYASVDAVVVLLAVHLAVGVVGHPVLDAPVAPATLGSIGLPPADVGTVVAVGAGLVAFAGELVVRVRRPLVEQFEAANPAVEEALRTARDASRADRTNPMARALYADVLDRLGETSSLGLVRPVRVGATVALALVLSVATVQTSVAGLAVVGLAGGGPDAADVSVSLDASAGQPTLAESDLQSGDEILGEATNVSAGSENVTAEVATGPGGAGSDERHYERGSGGDDGTVVEARRADYASPERVEDAALVRRYTEKLQGNTTDV